MFIPFFFEIKNKLIEVKTRRLNFKFPYASCLLANVSDLGLEQIVTNIKNYPQKAHEQSLLLSSFILHTKKVKLHTAHFKVRKQLVG